MVAVGPVSAEERPTCRTFDDAGASICESPARFIVWGHLYEKRDKGPKCGRHVPRGALLPTGFGAPAIYEIPSEGTTVAASTPTLPVGPTRESEAEHERLVRAEAWDEGYAEGHDDGIHDGYGRTSNPYRTIETKGADRG